jgi:tetratricopeptide (TPR) repeat protein
LAGVCTVSAQVYQVQGGASTKAQRQPAQPASHAQSLGWGSNIQNARLARAAQAALQRGDHAQALAYAQRAANAAPNDPEIWFLLGYAARLNDDYPLSVNAYEHGLRLDPSAADGRSGLAQDYSLMGRMQEAERLLQQVIAANPDRRSDVMLLGDIYLRAKDYGNAEQWLLKAEALRPGARAELLLAVCFQHTKQMDKARSYLEMARRRAPNNPDVERSLAGYYRDVGNFSEAIQALKSIRNPKPDVTAELAYTYQLDNKPQQAATTYKQAADEDPRNFDFQMAAAQAEVTAGSMNEAKSFLDRAQALKSNSYRVHSVRGEIAQILGRDNQAVREYQAAIASLPENAVEGPLYGIQLHMDLVALYRNLEEQTAANSELKVAQSQLEKVNVADTDRDKYLRLKSLIELNAGQYERALADVSGALSDNPQDQNNLQLKGDVLMKLGRVEQAMGAYKQVLERDPDNRFALISMGYASRAAGRDREAEMYFHRLAKADPTSATPYLALGDLYAAHKKYSQAQQAYSKGYKLNQENPLIVAGGLNTAVESHDMALGRVWMSRVTERMSHEAYVLREEERYLSFDGKYSQSAAVGQEAIKKLPDDRDVVVYLGYDLLHMGKYEELLALTKKYLNVLPKEPDIPLLKGYVDKRDHDDEAALKDFTEVLHRDPNVVTAYVNRGFLLNDLKQPKAAAASFQSAIQREPKDGEAHLGLAYADLALDKPDAAVHEAILSRPTEGDTRDFHVVLATAYGRENLLEKAVAEYRAALRFTPNDQSLHFGLGNTLFSERRYNSAIAELRIAEKLGPGNAYTCALLARAYASLHETRPAMHYVRLAEEDAAHNPGNGKQAIPEESEILLSTGEALDTLGDEQAAMGRFRRALRLANQNRVGVRLAIARLMAQQGRSQDAEREIALAWMEVQAGSSIPPTGPQFIEAADVFRSLHDYALSQTYLERAKSAGAPDAQVRIGLATNDLALGETGRAQAELAAIKSEEDGPGDYAYLIAEANVWRQKQENAKALTAFAQAATAAGANESVEQDMLQTGANEGLRVSPTVSLLSDFAVEPIFEDTSVYVLDSKLDSVFPVPSNDISLLPPPRSSLQTEWTDAFHLHLGKLPNPGGFFQLRNARGQISVPSLSSVVNRNTTDATFNFGLGPTVRLGNNVLSFNGGVQETIRRDSVTPAALNQNLFRVYAYLNTSSFFNAVSVNGFVLRETGPFTEINLHSRTLAGELNFRVGAPWSRTALLTGWGVNDQWFKQENVEDYYSSSYVGISHIFSQRVNFKAILEEVRAWRGFGPRWAIAQDLRPAANFEFSPAKNWDVNLTGAYSNNRGFHVYDAVQNGISVSYARPFRRMFEATSGPVPLEYPIRFSAGLQEETFFNFSGSQSKQFRPYIGISIF